MVHYAHIIQESQYDPGLQVSSFPEIGISALAFYSSRIAQKNNSNDCEHSGINNNYNSEDQTSEENLTDNDQTDQY